MAGVLAAVLAVKVVWWCHFAAAAVNKFKQVNPNSQNLKQLPKASINVFKQFVERWGFFVRFHRSLWYVISLI